MRFPVVTSCDPALGGGSAVITCALSPEKLFVLDCDIRYGLKSNEQIISQIESQVRRYRSHKLIIEINGMQKGIGNDERLATLGQILGFSIHPHVTQYNKNLDAAFGVASMDGSFRKKEVSIPYGDDETRRKMEELVQQLRKWRPDIPTKQLRQDAVMALWFNWREWMKIRAAHEPPVQALPGVPSWLDASPTQFLRRRAS